MSGAGIIADHQPCSFGNGNNLGDLGFPAQVDQPFLIDCGSDPLAFVNFVRPTDKDRFFNPCLA